MQVIRFSRVGKQNQAAFRIVLAEKSDAVKGAHQEILGQYNPSENRKLEFNKERIEYWISKGAKPSDSVAALLKTNGMSGMEKFMEPRNKKKRNKSAPAEEPAAPAAKAATPVSAAASEPAAAPAAATSEPAHAQAPAPISEPAEPAPATETPTETSTAATAETPAAEEAPQA